MTTDIAYGLLEEAQRLGYAIEVDDGGDPPHDVYRTARSAWVAVKAVESARVYFGKSGLNGWALIVNGLDPDETLADYSVALEHRVDEIGWIEEYAEANAS